MTSELKTTMEDIFKNIVRYGNCTYDRETQENGNFYRTRYWEYGGYMWETVQHNGELLVLKYMNY